MGKERAAAAPYLVINLMEEIKRKWEAEPSFLPRRIMEYNPPQAGTRGRGGIGISRPSALTDFSWGLSRPDARVHARVKPKYRRNVRR